MAALDHLGELERTHSCGQLRASDAGKTVVLMGWVAVRRDFGPLTFVDLRDRDGLTQVVFDDEDAPEAHARAKEVRGEYVIAVTGEVVLARRDGAQPEDRDGRSRGAGARTPHPERRAHAALPARRAARQARHRGRASEVSLSRSAPPALPEHPAAARAHRRRDSPLHGRAGLHRDRDADPHQVHARGRARLRRAVAPLRRATSTRCRSRRRSSNRSA